jgi:ParB family chromosome partitioning protein
MQGAHGEKASENSGKPMSDNLANEKTRDFGKRPPTNIVQIRISEIAVGKTRSTNDEGVKNLAESLSEIGQQVPISVRHREDGRGFELVAGCHRLRAAELLGWDVIDATVMHGDQTDARLWQISENLHRADLTQLERAEQTAEWVRLVEQRRMFSGQVVHKSQRGRPEGGIAKAARELPVPGNTDAARRKSIERSSRIGALSDEVKEAAKAAKIDDNQTALLAVANEPTIEAQLKKIIDLTEAKKARRGRLRHRNGVGNHQGHRPNGAGQQQRDGENRRERSRGNNGSVNDITAAGLQAELQRKNEILKKIISQIWEASKFNVAQAARWTGFSRHQLQQLLDEYGLKRPWEAPQHQEARREAEVDERNGMDVHDDVKHDDDAGSQCHKELTNAPTSD